MQIVTAKYFNHMSINKNITIKNMELLVSIINKTYFMNKQIQN